MFRRGAIWSSIFGSKSRGRIKICPEVHKKKGSRGNGSSKTDKELEIDSLNDEPPSDCTYGANIQGRSIYILIVTVYRWDGFLRYASGNWTL